MAHIVDSVSTTKRKKCPIVLDVALIKDILSGVIADSMLVLEIMRLNTVEHAKNFYVIYLSTNMIQNMDRRVHSQELDS